MLLGTFMANGNNGNRATHRNPDLSQTFALLTRKRQELFRPVLENPRGYVLLSVRELASRLKVDAATALRIILKMGFGSYREFQHYLHELSVSQATSFDMMQTSKTKGPSLQAHIQEAVDSDVQSLQKFRNTLDSERIAAIAKRLHQARRIVLLGGDLAANLAGYLHYHLILLGLPAVAATSSGEAAHLTRISTKDDVVIALSFRRGLRQTVEGLKQARANGAHCVGVADTLVSPIARFSHECLIVSVDTPSYGASYAAPMCLLNGLITACGYFNRKKNLALLKKAADEQRHGFRWYRD
ncbi:MAG TPA: MurR/RpiR family transcriptional regulator [Candidatus Acidoferrum sp.]|jgi:DNA-binding MurR/RpiR family transcriptional regulator